MKYKTLFRVLMKFAGLWLFIEGLVQVIGASASYLRIQQMQVRQDSWSDWIFWIVSPLLQIGFGCYLFFGGKWIADLAIPGNHPYCHECGYDLTGATGDRCNECGTPFQRVESPAPPDEK